MLDDHSPQRVLAHGLWTADERLHHITILELMAVTRNLMALNVRHRLKGKSVHLHEDNQAVCYILRRKTSRSPVLMASGPFKRGHVTKGPFYYRASRPCQ